MRPDASFPYDGPWRGDDPAPLVLAICLSVALHGLLLHAWRASPPERRGVGHAVIKAELRSAARGRIERAPSVLAENPSPASAVVPLLSPRAAPSKVSPPIETPQPRAQPQLREPLVTDGGQRGSADAPPTPVAGAPAPRPQRAGSATALLVIHEDGRVGQILWEQLPALTREQLARVETWIRERNYPGSLAGQGVREVIDVRAFLKLPQAREDAP